MLVDEKFLASLKKGGLDKAALLKEMQPPRKWGEEKVERFLNGLLKQTAGGESE